MCFELVCRLESGSNANRPSAADKSIFEWSVDATVSEASSPNKQRVSSRAARGLAVHSMAAPSKQYDTMAGVEEVDKSTEQKKHEFRKVNLLFCRSFSL